MKGNVVLLWLYAWNYKYSSVVTTTVGVVSTQRIHARQPNRPNRPLGAQRDILPPAAASNISDRVSGFIKWSAAPSGVSK